MLDAKDYGPGSHIYSYVVRGTGENIHIDSEKLREWCLTEYVLGQLEVFDTPVDRDQALGFLQDNAVDLQHLRRVSKLKRWDPIIYCKCGSSAPDGRPDVMLVDGHHRYFLAAVVLKHKWAPAFVLEIEQWKPFQIAGLPDISEETLRMYPPRGSHGR